ncbi:MAG: hypothetical protein WCL14_02140 [Bacteroidota bacterium]
MRAAFLPKVHSRQPAVKSSPDSSGSPLLGVGNGEQRLQRIAGRRWDEKRT